MRILALFGIIIAFFAMTPGMALADGEAISTTLRYKDATTGDQVFPEGVFLTLNADDGTALGTGTTDSNGTFTMAVPDIGVYTLEIDPSTLPEGVTLRDPKRTMVSINVLEGQTGIGIFPLTTGGETFGSGGITLRQVAQLTVEGIKLGLFLGMAAIGLSLIFGTTGLVNFAHGELIGWGMLIAYLFNFYGLAGAFGFFAGWPAPFGSGVNLIFAAIIATFAGAFAGYAFDRWLFAPLRRLGASLIAQMVVTIGVGIVMRYLFLFAFRGTPRFFKDFTAQTALSIGIIEITPKDLLTSFLSILVLGGVGLFLIRTRMGKAMRAVSDNRDLAESSGIDVQRVIRFVWTLGGALAGLGGVFMGLSEQVSWNIGFRILLLIFAGVILGGLGTAFGALVGSLVVGVGIQVSTLFIPVELKNVGALVVLILVLVVRPQGILGRSERVG